MLDDETELKLEAESVWDEDDFDLEDDTVLPDDIDDVEAELRRDDADEKEDEDELEMVLLEELDEEVEFVWLDDNELRVLNDEKLSEPLDSRYPNPCA